MEDLNAVLGGNSPGNVPEGRPAHRSGNDEAVVKEDDVEEVEDIVSATTAMAPGGGSAPRAHGRGRGLGGGRAPREAQGGRGRGVRGTGRRKEHGGGIGGRRLLRRKSTGADSQGPAGASRKRKRDGEAHKDIAEETHITIEGILEQRCHSPKTLIYHRSLRLPTMEKNSDEFTLQTETKLITQCRAADKLMTEAG